MQDLAIQIENLHKQYRLGVWGSRTLGQDLNRLLAKIQGKEDPAMKIGMENKLDQMGGDFVMALQGINLDVARGEVLGIIGKNGAGKSTLLKILSRVTGPSKGKLKINGRIASLLEVGTGFHPELTGKENIFLNGAILGMNRLEIKSKFDEIVEFAGIGKYINTPVKRYSSGMYVRLAFAVAAHLDPEIMVVDEVLAVGDVDFQRKALGKMGEVSKKGGRTILFVSHNMTAIKSLCTKAVMLRNGQMELESDVETVINHYIRKEAKNVYKQDWEPKEAPSCDAYTMRKAELIPHYNGTERNITVETPIDIAFEFDVNKSGFRTNLSLHLKNVAGQTVFNVLTESRELSPGRHEALCRIPGDFLNDDLYTIQLMLVEDMSRSLLTIDDILSFEVHEMKREGLWFGKWAGVVRPKLDFSIQ